VVGQHDELARLRTPSGELYDGGFGSTLDLEARLADGSFRTDASQVSMSHERSSSSGVQAVPQPTTPSKLFLQRSIVTRAGTRTIIAELWLWV